MAGRLTFTVDDNLRAIIAHARTASQRKPSYEQLYDEDLLKDGCEPGYSDSIDHDKIPPCLWLVKDDGVYLMSNGTPGLPGAGSRPNLVVYAKEADPIHDPDGSYDNARRIAGGDDFVEAIEIDVFASAIEQGAEAILFDISDDSMSISVILPKPVRKTPR